MTRVDTWNSNVTVSQVSTTVTRYDEAGSATTDQVAIVNYYLNSSTVRDGNDTNDQIVGTSVSDLVLWDDNTDSLAANSVWGSDRFGWDNGNSSRAREVFTLNAGDDLINLTGSGSGNIYNRAVTIDGGDGDDILWSGSGADTIYGAANDDTVFGAAGVDRVYGGTGNDFLDGGSGDDTLYGGANDDTLRGGAGADRLDGGTENDTADYSDIGTAVTVTVGATGTATGGGGTDTLISIEHAIGGSAADSLTGDAGANSLSGGGGNDTIFANAGDDFIFGGDGDDYLDSGDGNDLVYGGIGNDLWFGAGGDYADTFYGGDGNDVGPAGYGDDLVYGGVGDDVMYGGTDDDVVFGDANNDTVFGGSELDTVYGGDGNDLLAGDRDYGGGFSGLATVDILYGDAGDDTIFGEHNGTLDGVSADTLYGGTGADVLYGQSGDDAIWGGAESAVLDTYVGGDGNDALYFDQDTSFTGVNSGVQIWDGASASATTIFAGGATWNFSRDFFHGDSLSGAGTGVDTVHLTEDSDGDVFVLRTNQVIVGGSAVALTGQRFTSIEVVRAGAGADIVALNFENGASDERWAANITITGDAGADTVFSGDGDDTIAGGGLSLAATGDGADVLAGGRGNDVVFGDNLGESVLGTAYGKDTIFGGDGIDTLYGAGGDDTLYGSNTDTTEVGAGADRLFGGDGNDFVKDFSNLAEGSGGAGDDVISATYTTGAGTLDGGTGNDELYAYGTYTGLSISLGDGDDWLIADATSGGADTAFGGFGGDVMSMFIGNDTADGGDGNDALWGGAGNDVVYGGADNDFIYGGAGTGDTLYGGAGDDWFYVSRDDGIGDVVSDSGGTNTLVVFGSFATSGANWFVAGTGISDGNGGAIGNALGGTGSEVSLVANGGGSYTLNILNAPNGTAIASVTFLQSQVSSIVLWNSDNTLPDQTQEEFVWNGSTYAFTGYIG